jgi:DNA replication protein DnaC
MATPVPDAEAGTSTATIQCSRCEGRGWIVTPDGGAGSARRCDCFKENLGGVLLDGARLPDRYRTCRLENFDTRHPNKGVRAQLEQALAVSRRYVEGFYRPDGTFTRSGLAFIGPPGAGKTHLAVAILKELIRTYHIGGLFTDFTSLIHQIQSTFDPQSPESKRQILDPVIRVPLLVLDELGAQKPTPWVQDILYLVINSRYNERLPTIFTSNYALLDPHRAKNLDRGADPAMGTSEVLAFRIGARLVSRLCEMAQPVTLDAVTDHRREVKMPAIRV